MTRNEKIARQVGCTVDQVRAGYARNAEALLAMAEKAEKTGRKYNGYTAEELRRAAREYAEFAEQQ